MHWLVGSLAEARECSKHPTSVSRPLPYPAVVTRASSQAVRLGIPVELWRLVDALIRAGALKSPESAAELFPPVEIAPPPDTPLDDETAAVLRYYYTSSSVS